jgi:tRNA threonylcarbamoyladenosine biosynthesis protein TsaB
VLEAAQFGAPHIVGNAASMIAERWPADAAPPAHVDTRPAPEIAWLAWLGVAVDPATALARPYYLRAPDAKPQLGAVPHAVAPTEATAS